MNSDHVDQDQGNGHPIAESMDQLSHHDGNNGHNQSAQYNILQDVNFQSALQNMILRFSQQLMTTTPPMLPYPHQQMMFPFPPTALVPQMV